MISVPYQGSMHHRDVTARGLSLLQKTVSYDYREGIVNSVVAHSALLAAADSGLPTGTEVTVEVTVNLRTGVITAKVNPGPELRDDSPGILVRTVSVRVPERESTRVRPGTTRRERIDFDGREVEVKVSNLPADRKVDQIANGEIVIV